MVMQRLLLGATLLAFALPVVAQQRPIASPREVARATVDGKSISINYGSPRVKGREGHIFGPGGLISHDPHYPVWRGGANAATGLHTDADLKIGDLEVPKGDYTLFIDIANPDQWTLIVSKKTGEWGLAYDSTADLGRVKMRMSKPAQMVEDLTWTITPKGGHRGTITLAWEDHEASVPFSVH